MSIADKEKTPLELMADQVVRSAFSVKAVRWSQLNPEQQFAVALEQVVATSKAHLEALRISTAFAAACVEWRKTPEGQAWVAKQAKKRADAAITEGVAP